jgi:hypothetical protein
MLSKSHWASDVAEVEASYIQGFHHSWTRTKGYCGQREDGAQQWLPCTTSSLQEVKHYTVLRIITSGLGDGTFH